MDGKESDKASSFDFCEGYQEIALKIAERRGKEAAFDYYNMLIGYALRDEDREVPESDELMSAIWSHTKKMVERRRGKESKPEAFRRGSEKERKRNGRTLDDLSRKELLELFDLYESGTSFQVLKKKFWLRDYSISAEQISAKRRNCSKRSLETIGPSLSFYPHARGIPKKNGFRI